MSDDQTPAAIVPVRIRIEWLRSLAENGGKGVVDNIDARALGRIADEIERLRAELETSRELCTKFEAAVGEDVGEMLSLRGQLAHAREALTRIANIFDDTYICGSIERRVGDLARSILIGEPETDEG